MEPTAQLPPAPVVKVKLKARLSSGVIGALIVFLIAGSLTSVVLPNLVGGSGSQQPPVSLFLVMGLAMTALTALLFLFLGKLKLSFGKSALVLGFGFNLIIVLTKMVLVPLTLYHTNQNTSFIGSQFFMVTANDRDFNILVALSAMFLYVLAFTGLYLYFKLRLFPRSKKLGFWGVARKAVPLILVAFAWAFLLAFISPFGSYMLYAASIPMLIGLVMAFLMAFMSMANIEEQVRLTGSSVILANFFWIGLSVIFMYHVMWVIFMITLVHIWPFKTYTPK